MHTTNVLTTEAADLHQHAGLTTEKQLLHFGYMPHLHCDLVLIQRQQLTDCVC